MAIAYSYPKGTPTLTDTLVGIQYEVNKDPAVKQFGIGDIVDLVPVVTPVLSYKVYTALLTQTETSDPTAIILENTLGDVVWTRVSFGYYNATLTGAFTINKTASIISNNDLYRQSTDVQDTNVITVSTNYPLSPFNGVDGRLTDTFIEIRVYN